MNLRDYQERMFTRAMAELSRHPSTLIVAATGTGKTVLFGHVARDWQSGRVLIVAHRDELIQQAATKVGRIAGEDVAIEKGAERSNETRGTRARIVATSVQTMSRDTRAARFNPHDFGLVIIDEAHHATAETYLKVLAHFKQNPELKVLGVTATPDRADEEALGKVFASVADEYGIQNAIADGWLVPVSQQLIEVHGLDFSMCRTTAGDLNGKDLEAIMLNEKILHQIVTPTMEIAGDRKTLVFTASVAHAERACEIANRHREGCARWIHGGTPIDIRREILRRYFYDEFQFLFNCSIALEGFDEPSIGCVAIARPTKSRSLYAQAIGRGTRPLTGCVDGLDDARARRAAIAASAKPNVLILDYVGNSGRHKLVHTTDVLGVDYNEDELQDALAIIRERSAAGEACDVNEALELAEQRRKELARQRELAEAARLIKHNEAEALRQAAAKRRQHVRASAAYSASNVDPFNVFDLHKNRERGWDRGRKPTPKMLALLRGAKLPEQQLETMSFSEAGQLIGEIMRRRKQGLCSYGQAKVLKRYGYSGEVGFNEAKRIIDRIAANGWRRVEQPA